MARADIISNYEATLLWHAEFPIEGAGVVHVLTENDPRRRRVCVHRRHAGPLQGRRTGGACAGDRFGVREDGRSLDA